MENFSGKTCLAVEQDFHATVFTANLRALLAHEVTEESKSKGEESSKRMYEYKINKNVSVSFLKNELVKVLLDLKENIELFCESTKRSMAQYLVPVRPGRSFKRIRSHPKRKYFMILR
ncbi:MAG: hypothetical protein ACI8RA_001453 [Chlamydiales bacterium]|jgi:hypothetical protein